VSWLGFAEKYMGDMTEIAAHWISVFFSSLNLAANYKDDCRSTPIIPMGNDVL
jgi:hypothetical protein